MKSKLTGFALIAMVAALVGVPRAEAQDRFEWDQAIAAGKTIEIKGISGSIEASPASGGRVEVVATKDSRRSDTDSVTIEVVETNGNYTICAVYPNRSDREPNECRSGSEGRMNTEDNDVEVDFDVRVPDGVRFVGRNINGNIEALSIDADVEAYTVNGSVEVRSNGLAMAKSVNGSIEVSLGSSDWQGDLEFETVNGRITIELPAATNTNVTAETLNGGIESEFPLTVSGRFGPRRIRGTIGNGGRDLHLKTVNGAIRLRRSSQ